MGGTNSIMDCIAQDEKGKKLMEQFQAAVMRAANSSSSQGTSEGKDGADACEEMAVCVDQTCGAAGDGSINNNSKLQSFFEAADLNKDGILDAHEIELLIKRLDFDLSDELKEEMRVNMKTMLMSFGDDSLHMVFNQFLDVIRPSCKAPIIDDGPKRIVFVGCTGAGKSELCTALTGQNRKKSTFKIGSGTSSQTTNCTVAGYKWFGDESEDEFICIDTPGLDDENGRDAEFISGIIDTMRELEYVNAIVLTVNGQNARFSTSLQLMIKKFEQAFTSAFYHHSVICLTHWKMDEESIEDREEDGNTEAFIADELNSKLTGSKNLMCTNAKVPVVFVDSRDKSKEGKGRLAVLKNVIGKEVFRTADLKKVKPRITEVSNTNQRFRHGEHMASMHSTLFDNGIEVDYHITPELPPGLVLDPKKGSISGVPSSICPKTKYSLTAKSAGGFSEPYLIEFEVCHSETDIKNLVRNSMKTLSDALDALLPLDVEVPLDDAGTRNEIERAAVEGAKALNTEILLIKDKAEVYSTCTDILTLLQAEYDRKVLLLENEYLIANSAALSIERERNSAEKNLEIQLIRETTNSVALKKFIKEAEDLGVNENVLSRAQQWLEQIVPGPCTHAGKGCEVNLLYKERAIHEKICIFGLNLMNKDAVVKIKAEDASGGVQVIARGATKASYAGGYQFEPNEGEFYLVNRKEQRIQRLRPDPKGANRGHAADSPVEWVITSQTQQQRTEAIIARSTTAVVSPLDADFEDFEMDALEGLGWKKDAVAQSPSAESVKLIYFSGKWCPYCPPFTRTLAMFYKSIVKQKGLGAVDIVFVSSDQSEKEMFEYYTEEHGDYLALPFSERKLKDQLSEMYDCKGIPHLVIINEKMEQVSSTSHMKNQSCRDLFSGFPDQEGALQDSKAEQIYATMRHAVNLSQGGTSSSEDEALNVTDKNIDIFCSLRFGEGMKYAKQVRDALRKQKNLNAVIVEVPEGNDIASVVAEMIDAAKLVLIFGTQTYGVGTVSFSTKEELQFVMDDKKPFYLIKMCDKFSEARTRLMLHKGISYKYWNIKNDDPMPEDLIDQIVAKYQSVVLGTDSGP